MQYDRRSVLRAAAIGVLGAGAGCLDGVGAGSEGEGKQTDTPSSTTATPTSTETTSTSNSISTSAGTETTSNGETQSMTDESTSTATCESGLRRLDIDFPANFELAYREGFGFELSAAPDTVAVGEELTIELRNTTDEPDRKSVV